jgi:hypothetical protein
VGKHIGAAFWEANCTITGISQGFFCRPKETFFLPKLSRPFGWHPWTLDGAHLLFEYKEYELT